jgi:hypothetical protein
MLILAEWIQCKVFVVKYYENKHDPELKYNTGFSVAERLEMANEALKDARVDVNDWKRLDNPLQYLSDSDLLVCAQVVWKKALQQAYDFPENPWIFISRVKEAIQAKRLAESVEPRLKEYSLRTILYKK